MPRELTETCNQSLIFLIFLTLVCTYVENGRAEMSLYVEARASEHDAMFFVIDSVENSKNATGNGHVDLLESGTIGHGHGESFVHAYEHFYGEGAGGRSGYATVRASATATGTQRYSSIEGPRYYQGTAIGRGEIFHRTEVVVTPAQLQIRYAIRQPAWSSQVTVESPPGITPGRLNPFDGGSAFGSATIDVLGGSRAAMSLAVTSHNQGLASQGGPGTDVVEGVMVWGLGSLPGATVNEPLQLFDESELAVDPQQVAGAFLSMPITNDYGLDSLIYVGPRNVVATAANLLPGAAAALESETWATGYHYLAEGANFASFIIPSALLGGDDMFELLINGTSYLLQSGEEFDFTSIAAGGVDEFQLLGLDPDERIDPLGPAPFVTGMTFTNPGLVTMRQAAITPASVPEPSSLILAGIAGLSLAGRWSRTWRRRKIS